MDLSTYFTICQKLLRMPKCSASPLAFRFRQNWVKMRLNVCVTVFLISAISCWRNKSGLQLSPKPTQGYMAHGSRGKSMIEIGKGYGMKEMPTTTISTTAASEIDAEAETEDGGGVETGTGYVTKPQIRNHRNAFNLTIGIVVPFKNFGTRDYTKALTSAITALKKKDHEKQFKMNFRIDMLNLMAPSPIREYHL